MYVLYDNYYCDFGINLKPVPTFNICPVFDFILGVNLFFIRHCGMSPGDRVQPRLHYIDLRYWKGRSWDISPHTASYSNLISVWYTAATSLAALRHWQVSPANPLAVRGSNKTHVKLFFGRLSRSFFRRLFRSLCGFFRERSRQRRSKINTGERKETMAKGEGGDSLL